MSVGVGSENSNKGSSLGPACTTAMPSGPV